MIQLEILSGKMANTRHGVRHFPLRIGRNARSGLQLEEAGVWEEHAEIHLEQGEGYQAATCGNALLRVNGEPVTSARLRNGDMLDVGIVRIRFWLGDPEQRGLRLREGFTWVLIGTVLLGQVALIYLLL